MSAKVSSFNETPTYTYFRWPKTIISRFIARRTIITAAFWALAFGAIVASKSAGYAAAYPSAIARAKLATSFTNNVGINAIFGTPHDVNTITGFTVWNTLNVMVIVGAIWALLTATKTLRGEEVSGRWELLLSGQTTARKACINALAGLTASLVVMYVVASVCFIAIGHLHSVDFSTSAGLFYALAAVCGAAMFMAIGSLTAELMPTRAQAAGLAAVIFGVFFVIRAMADITTMHWLLWVTPLGWIEKLQPLYGSKPIWLMPIIALIGIVCLATVLLAQRDLGDSIFADKDTSNSHNKLLKTQFSFALRLTRSKIIAWLLAVCLGATFFGLLTKSASTAFAQSPTFDHKIKEIIHVAQSTGALLFLGIVFYLLMMFIMALVASNVNSIREDEAEGYLDNLVVRSTSRLRWLSGRLMIILVTVLLAGLLSTLCIELGLINQPIDLTQSTLLLAGLNAIIPALFVLGVGIFCLGFIPRLTAVISYGVIAWSFLISIISSGINLNHWIADTSILQHMALAPTASPNWQTNLEILVISLILIVAGALRFNQRDLQGE